MNNIIENGAKISHNGAPFSTHYVEAVLKNIANTIQNTFGPAGASTLFIYKGAEENSYLSSISKDGYSVLCRMQLTEAVPSSIKSIILQAMGSILATAGDGTSTTTLAISNLYSALANDETLSKLPPQVRANTISKSLEIVKGWVKDINEMNNKLTSEELKNIISTSLNGDKELERVMISSADELMKIGVGIDSISIRAKKDMTKDESSFEIINGYTIPDGIYGVRIFDNMTFENVSVAIINESIATSNAIKGLSELIMKAGSLGKPLLLLTYGVKSQSTLMQMLHTVYNNFASQNDGSVPPVFLANYYKGTSIVDSASHADFEACLGQPTLYELGESTKDIFDEAYTGPEMLMEDYVFDLFVRGKLPTVTLKTSKSSIILSDIKTESKVNTILESRKREIEEIITSETGERKDIALARKAKLEGKYAQITIGGENEWDVNRKTDAIEDAVGAIRLALKSKAVGGMSLFIPKVISYANTGYEYEDNNIMIVIKAIYNTFVAVAKTLMYSATTDVNDIEKAIATVMLNMSACKEHELNPTSNIKVSYDLRNKINNYADGKPLSEYATDSILNSAGAEVKILEASCKAVSTLLSINQVLLPDAYDASAYRHLIK